MALILYLMKTKLCGLAILLWLSLAVESVPAQIYSQNIIGYVNTVFWTGDTLFNNPLEASPDTLDNLFDPLNIPNGTTVSLWNPATATFDTTAEYTGGTWSADLTLAPGTGARLTTPLTFTNTIVGMALNHDGSLFTNLVFTPPPVFSGADGIYLLGDKCPVADTGTDLFLNVIGRLPNVGEQVTLLDGAAQTYATSTYLGNGNWDSLPTLAVGEAAFFKIDSAPEPGVFGLFSLGVLFLCARMQRQTRRRQGA